MKSDWDVQIENENKKRMTKRMRRKSVIFKKDALRKLMITLIAFGIVKYGTYLLSKNLNDYIDRTNGE